MSVPAEFPREKVIEFRKVIGVLSTDGTESQ
jgi:hypothetical protein